MKRSEMIKKICDYYWSFGAHMSSNIANGLLDELEKEGMLPPRCPETNWFEQWEQEEEDEG